jgi:predicted N-acetyltransferase YhbS
MSVRPESQNQGIRSKLITEGLKACRQSGHDSVIVLGHPEYYPKFGFKQPGTWSVKDPFGALAEAFMALELKEGALEDADGVVHYPEEFNNV